MTRDQETSLLLNLTIHVMLKIFREKLIILKSMVSKSLLRLQEIVASLQMKCVQDVLHLEAVVALVIVLSIVQALVIVVEILVLAITLEDPLATVVLIETWVEIEAVPDLVIAEIVAPVVIIKLYLFLNLYFYLSIFSYFLPFFLHFNIVDLYIPFYLLGFIQ